MVKKIPEQIVTACGGCPYFEQDRWNGVGYIRCGDTGKDFDISYPKIPDWCPLEDADA